MQREEPGTQEGIGVWQRGWKWVTHAARQGVRGLWNPAESNPPTGPDFKSSKSEILQYPYLQNHSEKAVSYALKHVRARLKNPQHTSPAAKIDNLSASWQEKHGQKDAKPPIELTCPICMELLVGGVTTPCGHTFCWQCLDQALLINPVCPVCRSNSVVGASLVPGKEIADLVKGYCQMQNNDCAIGSQKVESERQLAKSTMNLALNYISRSKKYDLWLSKRLLSNHNLRPSDMVDIRDTEHIWCTGIVKKVFVIHGKESLLIHYIGWSSLYDQVIPKKSQRLASYRFYTKRKGIARYEIEGGGQLQGYVLHNPWQEAEQNSESEDEEGSEDYGEYQQEARAVSQSSQEDNPEEEYPHSLLVSQLVSTRDHSNKY